MEGKRQHRSKAGLLNCNLRTSALPLVAELLLRGEDFDAVILSAVKACPERSEGNLLSEGIKVEADASPPPVGSA